MPLKCKTHRAGKPSKPATTATGEPRMTRGGPRPELARGPAKGPVPACGTVRIYLKGKGDVRPVENLSHNLLRCIPIPDPKPGKRSLTPQEGRGSSPWREDGAPSPSPHRFGIRVRVAAPLDRVARRERRLQEERQRKVNAYVFAPPYASHSEDLLPSTPASYRRSRRAVSPAPSAASEGGRDKGRNRSSRPLDVGIFDKDDSLAAHRSSRRQLRAQSEGPPAERQYLPATYRDRGLRGPSVDRGDEHFEKGRGRHRPAESLLQAWNVSESAPQARKTCTRQAPGAATPSDVPWGVTRRGSLTRYHRRDSILAGYWDGQRGRHPTGRSHSASQPPPSSPSLGTIGYDSTPVSPRLGKRIWRTDSTSVIPTWG